ncbi:MAG TPA: hypothetical protein DEH78_03565 [Solibacterales bacterium]|nr:hypothetical protein [Bryobacterales bacterium]
MLTIRNSVLQGVHNGVAVNCALRTGFLIPRGTYKLLPAVQDPVFGAVFPMILATAPFDPKARLTWGFEKQGCFHSGTGLVQYLVLSARAMPGINNVLVTSGFSSLVELSAKGGEVAIEVV